jgi:hypothetical protein
MTMRLTSQAAALVVGALLFAITIVLLLSLPGFLSDRDSTVSSAPQGGEATR